MTDPPDIPAGSTLSHLAEGRLAASGFDIIAIQGLSGVPDRTWTKDESQTGYWLRDWLPADLPTARIYTYGYDSNAPYYDQSFQKLADQLLTGLIGLRASKLERQASRSLLFVCHSLGGLVVKCALSKAFDNRGNEALNDIVAATKGIIFLGTPHTTSISELSTIISRIFIDSNLSKTAMVAPQLMRQIALRFLNLPWGSLPWKIVSFHEELPLPGTNVLAVDRSQTKLCTFPQVSLHKTHHELCRFSSEDDPSYVKLVESLRNTLLASKCADQTTDSQNRSQQEHEVLKGLASEDTSTSIPDPHYATLDWVFRDGSTFKSWLGNSSGLCWVHGKPGSGKSTLMKYFANNITSHEPPGRVKTHTLSTYFFFSQRGANQSVGSLLRSLLYQLLSSTSSYPSPEIFAKLAETREILGTDQPWGNEELTESLFHFVEKSTARGDSLYVVIDALDECDDHDSLVSFLERLYTSSYPQRTIWTCVSSRYSPSSVSLVPAWEVRLEDYNSPDIQNYVGAKLLEWPTIYDSILKAEELVQIIAERSEGVFLWSKLVIHQLLEVSHRKPVKDARELIVWLLPTDLGKAYETIMARISSQDGLHRRTVHNALSLVLHAWRPLSALELLDALAVSDGGHFYQKTKNFTQQDATTQLYMRCCGLLEISSQEPTVWRFAHESVRQFLQDSNTKAESHFQIAQICLDYVYQSSTPLQSLKTVTVVPPYTFRGYAVTYGMQHLSMAGKLGLTPKAEDIRRSPSFQEGFVKTWVPLYKQQFNTQNLFKLGKATAAHVMAYFGIPWVDSELWGVCHTDIDAQDHLGRTPLSLAVAMGHRDTCRSLIWRGANPNHKDVVYGQSPLQLASAHGHAEVVKLLLKVGANPSPKSGGSALHMATRVGSYEVVRLLLEHGADAEPASTHTGETPLSQAAALGHIPLVSLLLRSGAKVDNWDERGWTPLHHAVKHGRKRTIEVLLRTLTQHQLRTLRINLAKAEYSWVNTVLRAMLVCLCLRQCGQSEAPASDSPQESKTPTAPVSNQTSATSNFQPVKHKLDPDFEDEECEERDQGAHKKHRSSGQGARRFACPYYRKNATKYATGPCNKTGFQDIYRLKTHIKSIHNGMWKWPRCHICQNRFRPNEIVGHQPCVERDEPIDYDEGFDPIQLGQLTSKPMYPKNSTPEKCWYDIFKVLFPDWPAGKAIPNPYQDGQEQKVSPQEFVRVTREMVKLKSPEIIREIMRNSGRGEQALQQTLDRLVFGDFNSRFGLPPIADNQPPRREPESTSSSISRTRTATHSNMSPTDNINPSAGALQLAPNRLSREASYSHTAEEQLWNNRDIQGSYLPVPEWTSFTDTSGNGYHDWSSLDRHGQAISSSGGQRSNSLYSSTHGLSEAITDNTHFSDYDSTGHGGWSMNIGTNPFQFSQRAVVVPSSQQQQQLQLYTQSAASRTMADLSTTSFTFRGGSGTYQDAAVLSRMERPATGVTSSSSQPRQPPGDGMQTAARYGQNRDVAHSSGPRFPTAGAGGDSAGQDTVASSSLADSNYGK